MFSENSLLCTNRLRSFQIFIEVRLKIVFIKDFSWTEQLRWFNRWSVFCNHIVRSCDFLIQDSKIHLLLWGELLLRFWTIYNDLCLNQWVLLRNYLKWSVLFDNNFLLLKTFAFNLLNYAWQTCNLALAAELFQALATLAIRLGYPQKRLHLIVLIVLNSLGPNLLDMGRKPSCMLSRFLKQTLDLLFFFLGWTPVNLWRKERRLVEISLLAISLKFGLILFNWHRSSLARAINHI